MNPKDPIEIAKKYLKPIGQGNDRVWEEKPVSYKEFYDAEHGFVREPFFPIQDEFAAAMLGEDPEKWSTDFVEGQAYWGKGAGKDRTAAKILVYVIYKLLCMRDPMEFLSRGAEELPAVEDKLEVANVCINARLAQKVFFKYFTILLRACKNPKTGNNWFEEKGLNFRRDVHRRWVDFPKNITAHSLDSKEYTGEGLNLFFVIFDEIGGFEVNQAENLYNALVSTCRSRFPRFMKVLLISYKRSDNDYMNLRYTKSEKDDSVFRSRAATWEVNLKRKKEDFAKDYARDPEWAERTYECKGSTSEGGFIRYKNRVNQVFSPPDMQNPIIGNVESAVDLSSLQFHEWFVPKPETPYYIHVDLAKGTKGGDACGFAMGHFERDVPVNFPDDYVKSVARHTGFSEDKIRKHEGTPKVGATMDLVLQIKAPAGGEIMFEEIRNFIHTLRKQYKFPIHWVTYDGWQSEDSIQQLRKAGVNAEVLSVDKTPDAYMTLKNAIYEGVFRSYYHRIAVRELRDLIIVDTGGKKQGATIRYRVDHPEKSSARFEEDGRDEGSKDVSDAIAGCVAQCIKRGKTAFKFWAGQGKIMKPGEEPRPNPQTVQRFEAEQLTRYGEKPPSWYRRK